VSQGSPGFPYPEFSMKCYPETVMAGDTFYFVIVAKNPHTESIWLSRNFSPIDSDIQVHLRDSESQDQPLLFESEVGVQSSRTLRYIEIKPGDSRIIGALAINVPPLEDLQEPFWEKHLKNLSVGDEKFLLCTTVLSYSAANITRIIRSVFEHELLIPPSLETPVVTQRWSENELIMTLIENDKTTVETRTLPDRYEPLPISLETLITISQRPVKEMVLIREWYTQGQARFPETKKYCKSAWTAFKSDMPQNTVIKGVKFSHWYFVRTGNRYPGDSDRPETWQGWKELEESLTPSTMRDEIRLTRILIQYCDTEEAAVLKELKDWFAGMNEIQRTVMAKCIRDRAISTYGEKLLPQFRELYKAIREHDVVPIPESNKQFLRELGLIE